jgi:CheY-like chemotaxis protein
LKTLAEAIIIKTPESANRLFDEASLFLHRVVTGLPEEQQKLLASVRQREPLLAGRKVLIVDDDVRNIFSLASALEQHQMEVLHAENGRDGIAMLERMPDIDCVLMDIMMPDMDGYETIKTIRARDRFKTLPIVAITAKAMQGDREKCLEAGASEYAAKPVDMDQILSIIRVWLRKH